MKVEIAVALLRSVNVGGRNRLPMKDLVQIFEEVKCVDVSTYIQSGNVIFRAPAKARDAICAQVANEIKRRFEFSTPIVLRTLPELAQTIAGNPFLSEGKPESACHVCFLHSQPEAADIAAFHPPLAPPEAFSIIGREVYLFLPHGAGRSKLAATDFGSKLKTHGTARNWNTIRTLHELMSKAG